MTEQELEEIRAVWAAATPGEWVIVRSCLKRDGHLSARYEDLGALASAPGHVRKLLDEVDCLKAEVGKADTMRRALSKAVSAAINNTSRLREDLERIRGHADDSIYNPEARLIDIIKMVNKAIGDA